LLASRLADYVHDLDFRALPAELVEQVKMRIVDSIGVAIAALDAEPVAMARRVAEGVRSSRPTTIYGGTKGTSADLASFVNGCMVRYLDFLDTYLSKEALHPSDNIPAIIAAAESVEASSKEVIAGIAAAYEICCRLADAASIRARGWDHVTYIAISSAAGAARAMGLKQDAIAEAVNLAAVSNISLRQTRAGELSMWKGCAAANAARNGVFAAMLAEGGMRGPSTIFEGEMGFWNQVSGSFDNFALGDGKTEPFRVNRTSIKYYPVEYHAMSAVEAALKVRGQLDLKAIEAVEIETFTTSYQIIAKDPEKWEPRTRETADHSLPYIVAAALMDGTVSLETFTKQRMEDQAIRSLMKKTKVVVNPEHDRKYPEGIPNTVRLIGKKGERVEETITYPMGHFKNPMSRQQVEQKFKSITAGFFEEDRMRQVLRKLWNLENEDLKDVLSLLTK